MYRIIRSILFLLPAETAHHVSMGLLKFFCAVPLFKKIIAGAFVNRSARPVHLFGLQFRNAVGLGAGFDKNARYLNEVEALGFGFVEIGTVTPRPQPGNEKPRLFRLPKDQALINRMGFNNEGVEAVARRLKKWKEKSKLKTQNSKTGSANPRPSVHDSPFAVGGSRFLIGGNIGKNKITPNEEAWKDYEICFRALHPFVDFFVVNVSSPNTPGLRALQEKDALKRILTHLQSLNSTYEKQKPVLLKIAPDLSWSQIDDVIELAQEIHLDGLVATNTTIERKGLQTSHARLEKIGAGGLSGVPLKHQATAVVNYVREKTKGALPIIASGGVFTGSDAKEKLQAGASLVELWTGFIYEGPAIVKRITKEL